MKKNLLVTSTLAAALLGALPSANAQTAGYIVGSPQATVRGGASQNVDIVEGGGSGTASGTVSIKFAASPFDTARKYLGTFRQRRSNSSLRNRRRSRLVGRGAIVEVGKG